MIIGKLIPARAPIDLPPRPVEELRAPSHSIDEGEEGCEAEDFDGIEDDIDFEESEDNQEVPDSEAGEAPDLISEPELLSRPVGKYEEAGQSTGLLYALGTPRPSPLRFAQWPHGLVRVLAAGRWGRASVCDRQGLAGSLLP